MNRQTTITLVSCLMVLFSNCCKDKTAYTKYCFQQDDNPFLQPAFIRKDTANFGTCESAIGEQTFYTNTYPTDACINPNNPNQLCYTLYYGNPEYTTKLHFMDICTGEDYVISDIALSSPNWSRKNWIAFNGKNHQLYKVKPNGDSLTQLTFEGEYNRSPVWNYGGTKICFERQTGSTGHTFIADENATVIDTLPLHFHASDWSKEDKVSLTYSDSNGFPYVVSVAYYDLNDNTLHKVKEWYDYGNLDIHERSPNATCFSGDGNYLYWTNIYTVNKTDVHTGENKMLYSVNVPLPSNELLKLYSVINDDYLLLSTLNGYFFDTCKIRFLIHMNIMNANNVNEQKFIHLKY